MPKSQKSKSETDASGASTDDSRQNSDNWKQNSDDIWVYEDDDLANDPALNDVDASDLVPADGSSDDEDAIGIVKEGVLGHWIHKTHQEHEQQRKRAQRAYDEQEEQKRHQEAKQRKLPMRGNPYLLAFRA